MKVIVLETGFDIMIELIDTLFLPMD